MEKEEMKKFRVLSDLHLDVNDKYPMSLADKDVFTVICGDTSGLPSHTIEWINDNCPNGVGVSGNHLPYNKLNKTIDELRLELATAFPLKNSFTYLDCETDTFSKIVDGILFIGTCMYTDMKISNATWNPTGDKTFNIECSQRNMNDYRYGIKYRDDNAHAVHITATDYCKWFDNAYNKIERLLTENEQREKSLPVVLVTHHPLVTDFIEHNGYVETADMIFRPKSFNYASYMSNMSEWLKRHPSIKCYCCGHIHDVYDGHRNFYLNRDDGTRILVVNNARGYVHHGHDYAFNANLYVNVDTWTVEMNPIDAAELEKRKKHYADMLKQLAWFM